MKLFLVFCLLGLALAQPTYEPISLNYHEAIGIPEAARIKAAEEAQDFDGSRIVGGSAAALEAHPHLGGLVITLASGATSVCGSSLLTNNRAVTAAHCWFDGRQNARQLVVVLGSTTLFWGGTRVTTSNVAVHANYNPNNLNNDVAIITLGWVNYNNNIRNIALPSGTLLNNNFAGTWAQAAGFGRTADNVGISNNQILRQVNLQVITNAVCQQTFGPPIIASTLCTSGAGGVSVCGGDSGGPLAITSGGQRVLIGIASFVSLAGCQRNLPAGFARVTAFDAWIRARL